MSGLMCTWSCTLIGGMILVSEKMASNLGCGHLFISCRPSWMITDTKGSLLHSLFVLTKVERQNEFQTIPAGFHANTDTKGSLLHSLFVLMKVKKQNKF